MRLIGRLAWDSFVSRGPGSILGVYLGIPVRNEVKAVVVRHDFHLGRSQSKQNSQQQLLANCLAQ